MIVLVSFTPTHRRPKTNSLIFHYDVPSFRLFENSVNSLTQASVRLKSSSSSSGVFLNFFVIKHVTITVREYLLLFFRPDYFRKDYFRLPSGDKRFPRLTVPLLPFLRHVTHDERIVLSAVKDTFPRHTRGPRDPSEPTVLKWKKNE